MPYYSVHNGRTIGIFTTWEDCQKSVIGHSGAIFKKFTTIKEAEYFLKHGHIKSFSKPRDTECAPRDTVGAPRDTECAPRKNQMPITVYTDGACKNNGSPDAVAGIGVYFGEDDERNVSRGFFGKQTNNIAELLAVLEVSKILDTELTNGVKVVIFTDSTYAMKCCTSYGETQAQNGWIKNIPNRELVREIYETFSKYSNIKFKHVRAHTNATDIDSIGNYHADRLANEAAGL